MIPALFLCSLQIRFLFLPFQKRDPKVTNVSALCQCLAIMGNFSAEATAQRQMSASEDFGAACLGLMVFQLFCSELVFYLLWGHGLLINYLTFLKILFEGAGASGLLLL